MTVTALAVSNIGAGPWDVERRVRLDLGEFVATGDRNVVLTTTLGSSVSACIRDPLARIGGMNHFLLPEAGSDAEALSHGVNAMERLINALVRLGGRRERMQARLFGGADLLRGVDDLGPRTAIFAERYLRTEAIAFLGGDLGGDSTRLIQFWPLKGRARQLTVHASFPDEFDRRVFEQEQRNRAHRPVWDRAGDVELF